MPDYAFRLNDQDVSVSIEDPKTSSLEVLREVLGIHTCKAGCSPQGLCGCCTALIDGKPRLTCTLPVKSLAGKAVTTMDGLPEDDRAMLAESFVRAGGTQCGYCTPGIVLNVWSLLSVNASPTPEEVTRALNQHLCRCTGYTAIRAAVDRMAALVRGEPDPLPPRARPEGAEVVTGDRPYVDDLDRPGMLYGGVVFAPVAVGTLDALELDAARAVPGVRVVLGRKQAGDALAHAGEIVAAIAAESPAAVRAAQAALVVKATGAPVQVALDAAPAVARSRRVHKGTGKGAHVVGGVFQLAATDPVFLEPEAALAVPVAGGLHVYSPGHDAAGEAEALTAALGTAVRVFLVPSGGSYGGKTGALPRVAGELALAAGAPVRLAAGMEAGMRLHPRRPAGLVEGESSCDADGKLRSLRLVATMDGGVDCVDPDAIVAQALGALAYEVPDLDLQVQIVATQNPSAGPVRGGAGVAVVHAVERLLDGLADATGVDRLELRRRNAHPAFGPVLEALAPGWAPGCGVALAAGEGPGGARVVLRVTSADEVEVSCNVPELGQGRDEALLAALVGTTGLPGSAFTFAWADSALVGAGTSPTAPVERAARAAGAALAAAGGPLEGLLGRTFVGEDAQAPSVAHVGALVRLGAGGEVAHVDVVATHGADQHPGMVANLLEGAAHMGLGIAISEEVATVDGLPEGRLRHLGVLKPKGCATFAGKGLVDGGSSRDVAEAAVMAVPAAIAGAVGALEGRMRAQLPMKDSAAAKHMGIRPPKA